MKFNYDVRTARYRVASTGRFVRRADVRAEVDRIISRSSARIADFTTDLREGRISLSTWRTLMREEVKSQHLMHAMAAKGGRDMMTQADYGRVGDLVKRQYQFLERFVDQIRAGLPLDGRITTRAKQYAQSARQTYHQIERSEFELRNFDEERNVLGIAEHCSECVDLTDRGWVPIGTLTPIGQRLCRVNCKCRLQYRSSESRKVSAA